MTEHKDLDPTISLTGDRGIHSTEGISAVADVSTIIQVAPSGAKSGDRGRVVWQTGGANDGPGDYMLDGAGGFFLLGTPTVNVNAHASRHAAGGGDVLAHQALSGAGANTHAQIDTHIALGAPTKQAMIWTDENTNFLNMRTRSVGASGSQRFNIRFPHDFTAIVSLILLGQPSASNAAANIDLNSNYGGETEDLNTHTQSDVASTYNIVADTLNAIDISGLFTSVVAGDRGGLLVNHMSIGATVQYLGIDLRYT
jgi:hypothetical protein